MSMKANLKAHSLPFITLYLYHEVALRYDYTIVGHYITQYYDVVKPISNIETIFNYTFNAIDWEAHFEVLTIGVSALQETYSLVST